MYDNAQIFLHEKHFLILTQLKIIKSLFHKYNLNFFKCLQTQNLPLKD